MKKTIITSAILLFTQIAIFVQTPVASPSDSSVQTPKNDKSNGRDGNREKQPKMSAADRAVQYSNELKMTLALTPDQFQKVLAVNTECISRKDAIKGSGDKGTMKTGKADIKAYRIGEFQKIFTAQQMTAYQQMNANKNEKDDDEKDGNRGERGKGKKHVKDDGEQKTSN
jgi:hypothetical protein